MEIEHLFARDEEFPSWWPDAVARFIGLSTMGYALSHPDATHVQVVAGANAAAAVIGIQGRMRWNEATVSRAHPGGAAGTYDIFATAADDVIGMDLSDSTNRAHALAIVTHNSTPAIVAGTVDIFRKVGECDWDGAQIMVLRNMLPLSAHAHRHRSDGEDPLEAIRAISLPVGLDEASLTAFDIAGTAILDAFAEDATRNVAQSARLLDSAGRSSFLQMAASPGVFSAAGETTLAWDGLGVESPAHSVMLRGAANVSGIAVPAGLLSNGKRGLVSRAQPDGAGHCLFSAVTSDGSVPAAGVTMPFAYLIWGV